MTADERAALVERLRDDTASLLPRETRQAADLIEVDGKRLALAEKTIADAATALDVRGIPFGADMLAVWDRHIAEAKATLRDYDAAKEAIT